MYRVTQKAYEDYMNTLAVVASRYILLDHWDCAENTILRESHIHLRSVYML